MSYSPIGDTIAVTNLAYNLYTRVYVVARDAPEQFGELARDLQIFKNVLYQVREQVGRDTDSTYSTIVQKVLRRCSDTLRGLRDLTVKYEKLAWSDRGAYFLRLRFASEQSAITELRNQFSRHQQTLQLVLTVDGRQGTLFNPSPISNANAIFRNRLHEAAKQDEKISFGDTQSMDERAPGRYDIRQESLQDIRTVGTGTTLQNPRDSMSSLSPRIRGRKSNFAGQDDSSQPPMISRSLSVSTAPSKCSCHAESLEKAQASGIEIGKENSFLLDEYRQDLADISPQSPSLDQSTIPSPSRTKQPLNLSLDREKHNASRDVQAAFRESYESLKDEFSTETWLRLATWWLVKSRTVCRSMALTGFQRRKTDASLYQDGWEITISAEQAYTDLLKSSWILEKAILAEANEEDLSYTNIQRIINILAVSLDRDLRDRRGFESDSPSFEEDVVLKHDLNLLEGFEQTIEFVENVPCAIDDPNPAHRWFETDQDNAGAGTERVMYRTFVNAQLGTRAERSKSSSVPYMLLLWTTADESDLLITLCNQRGTVNLSRKMTAKDLENVGQADGLLPLAIDFPSQDAEIKFLSPQDLQDFFARPQLFFAAMKERIPLPGELAIHQAPLAKYCDSSSRAHGINPTTASITSSKTSACGLTFYEAMPDKCWRTTRRLVIHSAPDSTQPICASHWLPLDHVRISVDGLKATMYWSDCAQLKVTKPGNCEIRYSYVYKPEEPNRKIELQFRSNGEALKFQECLLYLTDTPAQVSMRLNISSAFQDARIYRLFDADEPDSQYHGLVLTRKSPQGPHTTESHYVYRDLDWVIETKSNVPSIIKFSQLHFPHYVSTLPSLIYEPGPNDPLPEFSHVTDHLEDAKVELGCDHDLIRFMHSLTGWRLKYFRRVPKLVIIEVQMVKDKKDTFQMVDVQLWEKASEEGKSKTQLTVRFEGDVRERWMTASLVDNGMASDRLTLEMREVLLQRGIGVDSRTMTAKRMERSEQRVGRKRYKIAMTFKERAG